MAVLEIVEGWTEPLVAWLENNGAPPDVPLTSTPTLILTGTDGVAILTTGDVAILDAATWKVSYTPDAGDIVAATGPYTAHWRVDQGGAVFFFPRGAADVFRIYRP